MNIKKLIKTIGDINLLTPVPEVKLATELIASIIEDETVSTEDYLEGLTDEQLRQLLPSVKKVLYERRN